MVILMNKKILYIVTKSDLGGVTKYLLELVNHLPKNYEPFFIMSSKGYFSEELEKLGLNKNIFFVPMTNSIFDIFQHIKSNLETLKIINKIKPDLIHCNSMTGGIVGRICGSLSFTPVVFTAHGWTFSGGYSNVKLLFYQILENLLAPLTKKIICVSKHDLLIGRKFLPLFKNKMVMIHNGISDTEKKNIKQNFCNEELKIVMISRFCWPKDPFLLLESVNSLINDGLNIKLDFYGYGEYVNDLEKRINDCNKVNIRFMGEVENVIDILLDYDVYSLTSDKEGLPIGIIEALRSGLPILVSDVGGNSECVNDNGYLVKKQDVEDCKEKIRKLYDERNNLAKLGQNSRKIFEEEFSVQKMVQETHNIYEKCSIKIRII